MRKIIALTLAVFLLSGCNAAVSDDDNVFVIDEQFFVLRMLDIVFSHNEFLGQTIRYEGMFRTVDVPTIGDVYQVYRYTDGCCGPDGIIGLQVRLDSADIEPLPTGTWVEVTGILEEFEHQGRTFLRLEVTSLIEMDDRGEEFVTVR
ncbi:MAG: lipoprotein [Defluviitaleaceae bacterium]|nr:lipoprotein [Defluviitaleaceae bacterium]